MIKYFVLIGFFIVITIMYYSYYVPLTKHPRIIVDKLEALTSQPIKIQVVGLRPLTKVTIKAGCCDKDNRSWHSYAVFIADEHGVVDVAQQEPIEGSYKGRDGMGLIWSMKPEHVTAPSFSIVHDSFTITFSAYVDGVMISSVSVKRLLLDVSVIKKSVQEDGVVGTFFYQQSEYKQPVIIVLPGSDGGIPEKRAGLYASHGYAVLALGYFGLPGLPQHLENIPLEYFLKAVDWIKKQSMVDGNAIVLIGTSRGGELALLLASTFPTLFKAVVACVPSSVVYGGFPAMDKPAWTYQDKAFGFVPSSSHQDIINAVQAGDIPLHHGTIDDPYIITPIFEYDKNRFWAEFDAAAIPVEQIACPVLLLSGTDDAMWPSTMYCNKIMQRLDEKKSTITRIHYACGQAGHDFAIPHIPSTCQLAYHEAGNAWCTFGGGASYNAQASRGAFQVMMHFIYQHTSGNN